jgi:hypothetical protein
VNLYAFKWMFVNSGGHPAVTQCVAVRQCAAVRAAVCGSAHGCMRAMCAIECSSALGSIWHYTVPYNTV